MPWGDGGGREGERQGGKVGSNGGWVGARSGWVVGGESTFQ